MSKFPSAGDNVHVEALVVSVNDRNNTAKISIGWGPQRTILTVPRKLVHRVPDRRAVEAVSWAQKLLDDSKHH